MPAAIPLFWAVSTLAAYFYARQQGIPSELLWAALPAFLLEATLYLLLGLESARRRLEALPFTGVAVLLTFFGVLPYAAATFALGVFDLASFAALLALAALLSFWYIFLPPRWSSDLAFLVVMVTAILSGVVREQYPSVHPKLPLSELGHVMWFRTGIAAILMVRKVDGLVFGF